MDYKFWDERYQQSTYVYGKGPNAFFKQELDRLTPGKILLPCEGEGRNAVYAAEKGWHVDAFDFSHKGKEKCVELAKERNVTIGNFWVSTAEDFQPFEAYYDEVGLFFCHIAPESRIPFHQEMVKSLKTGGRILFEAFPKEQLAYDSGGPPVEERLFDLKEVSEDFKGLEFHTVERMVVELNEGPYHQGNGSVIRMIGEKTDD